MSGLNPSTVWTQLALPKSPVGTVPFVSADGVTINTDAGYLNYTPDTGQPVSGSSIAPAQLSIGGGERIGYVDLTGTPAIAYTIDQPSGRVTMQAGRNTITINSKYCFNTSMFFLQMQQHDATVNRVIVPASHGNGSFSILADAVATANINIQFMIVNTYLPA